MELWTLNAIYIFSRAMCAGLLLNDISCTLATMLTWVCASTLSLPYAGRLEWLQPNPPMVA